MCDPDVNSTYDDGFIPTSVEEDNSIHEDSSKDDKVQILLEG